MPCQIFTNHKQPGTVEFTCVSDLPSLLTWTLLTIVAATLGAGVASFLADFCNMEPWLGVIAAALVVFLPCVILSFRGVASERLLVYDQMCIVLQQHCLWGLPLSCDTIDVAQLEAVTINEVLTAFTVIPYLTFILKDQKRVSVAFQGLKPRLSQLIPVYQALVQMGIGGKSANIQGR